MSVSFQCFLSACAYLMRKNTCTRIVAIVSLPFPPAKLVNNERHKKVSGSIIFYHFAILQTLQKGHFCHFSKSCHFLPISFFCNQFFCIERMWLLIVCVFSLQPFFLFLTLPSRHKKKRREKKNGLFNRLAQDCPIF